jgi:hypothetical protein
MRSKIFLPSVSSLLDEGQLVFGLDGVAGLHPRAVEVLPVVRDAAEVLRGQRRV